MMTSPTISRTETRTVETFQCDHSILECSVTIVNSTLASVVAEATAQVDGPEGTYGRGFGTLAYQNGQLRCDIPFDGPTADVFADFVEVIRRIILRETAKIHVEDDRD